MIYKVIFVLTAVVCAVLWAGFVGLMVLDWYLFAMGV